MLLCQRFNNLDPLKIDSYNAIEVFTLVRDMNEYYDRNNSIDTEKSNKKVHRVQVKD